MKAPAQRFNPILMTAVVVVVAGLFGFLCCGGAMLFGLSSWVRVRERPLNSPPVAAPATTPPLPPDLENAAPDAPPAEEPQAADKKRDPTATHKDDTATHRP